MIRPAVVDPRTYRIIGAGMEVNRQLGTGFLEAVIANAFEVELSLRHIPFIREAAFPIHYKGHRLQGNYRADFLCFDEIIVEVKSTANSRQPTIQNSTTRKC
jgi:GxxExxY protein